MVVITCVGNRQYSFIYSLQPFDQYNYLKVIYPAY